MAAPTTLAWRYEVKLDPRRIKKAMWAAVSPNGKLLWTSSGNDLLAFAMDEISPAHAWPAHGPITPVRALRDAVPPSGVTGGTFYRGRLYLAGNEGTDMEVWSVNTATGHRRLEISRHIVGESEGIAAFAIGHGAVHTVAPCSQSACLGVPHNSVNRFGGVLHWMIMPVGEGGASPTYLAPTTLSFASRS